MTPCRDNTNPFHSSQQLPCVCLVPLKGYLNWHDLPHMLLPELQRIKGQIQVCHARRGGPRTWSRTTDLTLDSSYMLKMRCFKNWESWAPLSPHFTTPLVQTFISTGYVWPLHGRGPKTREPSSQRTRVAPEGGAEEAGTDATSTFTNTFIPLYLFLDKKEKGSSKHSDNQWKNKTKR